MADHCLLIGFLHGERYGGALIHQHSRLQLLPQSPALTAAMLGMHKHSLHGLVYCSLEALLNYIYITSNSPILSIQFNYI